VDGFEVDDGRMPAEVEDVLADTKVSSAPALFSGEVRERVLDLHALA
jgi:hypothetical protein